MEELTFNDSWEYFLYSTICENDYGAYKKYFINNKSDHYVKLAFYIYTADNMSHINEGIDFFRKFKKDTFKEYGENFNGYKKHFMRYYYNWHWSHQQKITDDKKSMWQFNKVHVSYIIYIMKVLKHYKIFEDSYYFDVLMKIPENNYFDFIKILNAGKSFTEEFLHYFIDELMFGGEPNFLESLQARDNYFTRNNYEDFTITYQVYSPSMNIYTQSLLKYYLFKITGSVNKVNVLIKFINENFKNFVKDGNYLHNILYFVDGVDVDANMPLEWQLELIKK